MWYIIHITFPTVLFTAKKYFIHIKQDGLAQFETESFLLSFSFKNQHSPQEAQNYWNLSKIQKEVRQGGLKRKHST